MWFDVVVYAVNLKLNALNTLMMILYCYVEARTNHRRNRIDIRITVYYVITRDFNDKPGSGTNIAIGIEAYVSKASKTETPEEPLSIT